MGEEDTTVFKNWSNVNFVQFRQTVKFTGFPWNMDAKRPYFTENREIGTLGRFFLPNFLIFLLLLNREKIEVGSSKLAEALEISFKIS